MDLTIKKAAIEKQLAEARGEAGRLGAIINALEGQLLLIREMEQPAPPANRASRRRLKSVGK